MAGEEQAQVQAKAGNLAASLIAVLLELEQHLAVRQQQISPEQDDVIEPGTRVDLLTQYSAWLASVAAGMDVALDEAMDPDAPRVEYPADRVRQALVGVATECLAGILALDRLHPQIVEATEAMEAAAASQSRKEAPIGASTALEVDRIPLRGHSDDTEQEQQLRAAGLLDPA